MRPFLDEDFLLTNETARELYHTTAEKMPILDYHCHVSPKEIAENRVFYNLTQLWLEGDHYKWRLMRANGVDERYITGNAGDFEKFEQWAGTLDRAVGNPLYHWSHLELHRYFGYKGHLGQKNAKEVWNFCQTAIGAGISVREILKKSNVTLLCTTDDPVDSLEWHQQLASDKDIDTIVLPAFRPDKAVNIEKEAFADYLATLSSVAGHSIENWAGLTAALEKRLNHFAANGCVLSDHGLDNIHYLPADEKSLDAILKKRLRGVDVTEQEKWQYKTELLRFFAQGYAQRDWAMQLHFAAQRDNSAKSFRALGPDTGYDCIGPSVSLPDLAALLSALEEEDALPKTVLYSLNPADNEGLISLMGCFQGREAAGKMQHGSAWWFNDHKNGMTRQLTALASGGLLGNFIGMLTDSRSFLSYTRHEYFRRILCNLLGRWAEEGELPDDRTLLEQLTAGISYQNCVQYFNFEQYHLRGATQT